MPQRKFRAVYLDHVARLSGGEIALLRLLPALAGDVDIHLILGEDGPLVERMREAGIHVEVFPLASSARDVRKDAVRPRRLPVRAVFAAGMHVWRLRGRLRELRPDLVHTNSLKAALYGGLAARLAGVPVVWHIRDRIAPDYLPLPAVWLVKALCLLLPNAVVANSETTLATLPRLRTGSVVRNVVIYDGSDEGARSVVRTGTCNGARPFRIGIVGRLAPWKGQQLFIEAFARTLKDLDTEAWIVGSALFGEDGYEASLRHRVGQLGISDSVIFRGFRENVWAELAELDALVHCSLSPEPFGQVIVEGMLAGVPVIAAAAGGPAEVITSEVDGLLTPPGDVDALSSAMLRMHDDAGLRRRLSEAARLSCSRYTPERSAQQLLQVYRRISLQTP